jgi:hypothetical protein
MSTYPSFYLPLLVVAILTFSPLPISAENVCDLPSLRIDQRPDPDGPPTEIEFGLLVSDITAIDDIDQTISGDFISVVRWVDPRLSAFEGCRFPVSKVWNPRLEILNSAQLTSKRKFQNDQVEVGARGMVRYYERTYGSIATYHHLRKFPFDPQKFRFRITSIDYDANEIVLKADRAFTRVADLVNIADWTIGQAAATIEHVEIDELGFPRSIFVLEIPAVRNTNFYIWKVLVPLILIVMMSWSVFWVNPVKFGPQIGLTATVMLTLIAFQFSLTNIIPKLSYFTTMDKLILGSSILVFMAMVESVLALNLVSKGKEEAAVKLDAVCRWFFPIIFISYWIIILYSNR